MSQVRSGAVVTEPPDLGPFVEIRLLQLPVRIWARAQEHTDELLREFTLIAEQVRQEPGTAAPLPLRLVQLVEELSASYAGFSAEQEAQLFAAAAAGQTEIDLAYRVPAEVGPAARHLGALLSETDEYCRAGQHLLTLTTPPELVRFREWFLDEFARQSAGEAPTAWPDYRD